MLMEPKRSRGRIKPLPLLRRIYQPVEKVGIEPIATTNRAPKAPKPAYLAPDLGQWRASREFFNRLYPSTTLGE
jgi:hypothetical protein